MIPHRNNIIWSLSFSVWLHLMWSSLDPSMLLQMASFHSFLWLSNIPLYSYLTFNTLSQWLEELRVPPPIREEGRRGVLLLKLRERGFKRTLKELVKYSLESKGNERKTRHTWGLWRLHVGAGSFPTIPAKRGCCEFASRSWAVSTRDGAPFPRSRAGRPVQEGWPVRSACITYPRAACSRGRGKRQKGGGNVPVRACPAWVRALRGCVPCVSACRAWVRAVREWWAADGWCADVGAETRLPGQRRSPRWGASPKPERQSVRVEFLSAHLMTILIK